MSGALSVFAPASMGNVAAGFDMLGVALAPLDGTLLGDIVHIEAAPEDRFVLEGPYAPMLSGDSRPNLVTRVRDLFRERTGCTGAFRITLEKRLPVNSGLGSSASSVVAALVAMQSACGSPLDNQELLALAGRAEGCYSGAAHLDNVMPCLLGGLRMVVPGQDGCQATRELPWPRDLAFVVVHPQCEVPTAQARAVLPQALALGEAVAFAGNFAAFIHALHTGDRALLERCFRDLLAEPHRACLVPGFSGAKAAAQEAGALAFSFSGSGPSVFAVVEESRASKVTETVRAAFKDAGLGSQAWICGLDAQGARLI